MIRHLAMGLAAAACLAALPALAQRDGRHHPRRDATGFALDQSMGHYNYSPPPRRSSGDWRQRYEPGGTTSGSLPGTTPGTMNGATPGTMSGTTGGFR